MKKGYEKLDVYKLSRKLAIEVHRMSLTLPKFEMYEEGSQIRRSSKSACANIVEGYALRRHKNEYLQYLHRALGSSDETIFHLGILHDTRSLTDDNKYTALSEQYQKLGKMLFRFIEAVNNSHASPAYLREENMIYEA